MKKARLCFGLLVLIGITILALHPMTDRSVLLASPQSSAAHPPDTPPAGPPAPGEPIEYHPKPPHPPDDFQQDTTDARAPQRKIDAAQAHKDAQELATLAARVQGEVDQLSKQVLSKDLADELKQIQKLAKRLRSEITP